LIIYKMRYAHHLAYCMKYYSNISRRSSMIASTCLVFL